MYRYLLFDLDDTLLDFHLAEANALAQTLREQGIEPSPEMIARYSAINQRQWELLEQKKITRDQVLIRRFELFFQELGISVDAYAVLNRYEYLLSFGHDYMPGAEALLKALYGWYPMSAVSNGAAEVQNRRIALSGMGTYFEKIFISETLGADKPQKAFFDRVFAELPGILPEETLIIGDSLTSDMRGGLTAGIHTCWFNPKGKPRRKDIPVEHEIRELGELIPLLEAKGAFLPGGAVCSG